MRSQLPSTVVELGAPESSHFGSVAEEVDLRSRRVDQDHAQFALTQATSSTGVPMALMSAPGSGASARRRHTTGEARPPRDCTLCGGAMGFAAFSPGGADLLRWYRSHGTECDRQARVWLGRRVWAAGWASTPWDAWWLVDRAMMRVRRGARRTVHFPPAGMGQKRFDAALAEASARLRFGILDAEHAYLQAAAGEPPGSRHTGNRAVHYPTRPNCYLRKAPKRVPEEPLPLDKAA